MPVTARATSRSINNIISAIASTTTTISTIQDFNTPSQDCNKECPVHCPTSPKEIAEENSSTVTLRGAFIIHAETQPKPQETEITIMPQQMQPMQPMQYQPMQPIQNRNNGSGYVPSCIHYEQPQQQTVMVPQQQTVMVPQQQQTVMVPQQQQTVMDNNTVYFTAQNQQAVPQPMYYQTTPQYAQNIANSAFGNNNMGIHPNVARHIDFSDLITKNMNPEDLQALKEKTMYKQVHSVCDLSTAITPKGWSDYLRTGQLINNDQTEEYKNAFINHMATVTDEAINGPIEEEEDEDEDFDTYEDDSQPPNPFLGIDGNSTAPMVNYKQMSQAPQNNPFGF